MSAKKVNGFTLVELMSVVAVIAVLAAIATPMYQKYVVRANRADVQTAMVQIAQKLAAYKLANNDFSTTLTNNAIYGATRYPVSGTATYNLGLVASASSWTLTATAVGKQVGNGNLVLNDRGWRCWDNPNGNTLNACVSGAPTATTTWDRQ